MNEKIFIELYQRQKESGLSVREFCSNEIIAPSTFYHWKKKLISKNRLPDFIPVVLSTENIPPEGHAISPAPTESTNSMHIEIEFPNKTILRISKGLDMSMLKALINLND